MIRYFFCITTLMCLSFCNGMAQTTTFNSNWTTDNGEQQGKLYSLEIRNDGVIVTIALRATKKLKRLNYWTTTNTYLWYGDTKENSNSHGFHLKIAGYYRNGNIEQCGYDHQWGWDNVSEGEIHYYKLFFRGTIPPGATTIGVVDPGDYYGRHGYWFQNYTNNNPQKYTTQYSSEYAIKQKIDQNNDGYCGIYEEIGSTHNKYACIKENGEYMLLFMGSDLKRSWWKMGDIKSWLTKTPSGIFKCKWLMSDKSISNSAYALFDGLSLTIKWEDREDNMFLKTYPQTSPSISGGGGGNAGEWSGTGFALTNGYIVTNHHVVDGANSIIVMGVNGNSTQYKAKVVGVDKNNDLALIKIEDYRFSGFSKVPYAVRNRQCEVGEDIFVLGYPLTTYMGDEIKLTNGIISSRSGYQGDVSSYQISAPVQPGNSGGPMFDKNGNIVGIVNAGIPGAENVGYAIKTSYLFNLVDAVSTRSIIPQNNTVSGSTLADKVRQVKNHVFFIKCKGE